VRALLDAETPVVTLVAKSDVRHVERALRTTLDENLAMVRDTVELLVREGRRVFLDCEHFFDGYFHNPEYTTLVAATALSAGAEGRGHVRHQRRDAALPDHPRRWARWPTASRSHGL
jgi:2-isopropylmalate synthase